MISRTSTSSGLSSLVGFLRPTSHGGKAVANAPCGTGFSGAGYGGFTTGPEAVPVVTPIPVPHVLERGRRRRR